MMRSASSSDHLVPRQVENAPLHVRASLCSTASILALAAAALCWSVEPVRAACTPTVTPTTGQIVTCNTNPPNPVTEHSSIRHSASRAARTRSTMPARSTTGSRSPEAASTRSRTVPARRSIRPSASRAARIRSTMPARSTTGSPSPAMAAIRSPTKPGRRSTRPLSSPATRKARSSMPARSTTVSPPPGPAASSIPVPSTAARRSTSLRAQVHSR